MAANVNPIFTITPLTGLVQIATANTNRDGTGTLGSVVTAASNGTRIDGVRIQATGTTTAGVVRLFINDGGATTRLIDEILVTAITPSTSIEAFSAELIFTRPIVLQSGYILKASTNNAETFNVFAWAGSY